MQCEPLLRGAKFDFECFDWFELGDDLVGIGDAFLTTLELGACGVRFGVYKGFEQRVEASGL